ncbi:MAG: triose-phosphate isomerase [bacterium]
MTTDRTPVLAANWKMHHGPTAATAFLDAFLARYTPRDDRSVILFPSGLALAAAQAAASARPDIRFGVQNIHAAEKGAFTGETSASIAADAGATYVLVGHSERRHVFGETDAETAEKCARAAAHQLVPVLCVGEKLEEREAGATEAVVLRQLRAGLAALEAAELRQVIIAYEPVWAIGTGRTATPQDASSAHTAIRAELRSIGGAETDEIPILYGGSVNVGNAATLLGSEGVDGLLVGGASLEAESWASICNA